MNARRFPNPQRFAARTIFVLASLMAGCENLSTPVVAAPEQPCWAVANDAAVQRALKERLFAQYPAVRAAIQHIRDLEEKRRVIPRPARLQDVIREAGCLPKIIKNAHGKEEIGGLPDLACIREVRHKIETSPEVLEEKKVTAQIDRLRTYRRDVDAYLATQTRERIRRLAQGKYGVVLRPQEPLYANSPLRYDITEQVIAQIGNQQLPPPPSPPELD